MSKEKYRGGYGESYPDYSMEYLLSQVEHCYAKLKHDYKLLSDENKILKAKIEYNETVYNELRSKYE